jgi:hypothetical protein
LDEIRLLKIFQPAFSAVAFAAYGISNKEIATVDPFSLDISRLLDSIARRMKKWMIGAVFVQSSQPQPSTLLRDTPTILVACV